MYFAYGITADGYQYCPEKFPTYSQATDYLLNLLGSYGCDIVAVGTNRTRNVLSKLEWSTEAFMRDYGNQQSTNP